LRPVIDGITEEGLFYWPNSNLWIDDHGYHGDGYHNYAYGAGYSTEETFDECRSYRRNGSCRRYRTVPQTITIDPSRTPWKSCLTAISDPNTTM